MGKRTYKITKKGDTFIAKLDGNIVFEGKVKHLRQCGIALITTNTNGKHDLYLPVRKLAYNCFYLENKERCLPVLRNFSNYQAFEDMLLLRMDDCCLFIKPSSFSMFLSYPSLLKERTKNIPLVPMEKVSYIDPETVNSKHQICHIDNSTYTIESLRLQFCSPDTQILVLPKF